MVPIKLLAVLKNPRSSMKLSRSANLLLLASALAVSALSARATTIVYSLTGVTTSVGSLTGTLSVNSLTDLVTASNITFNDASLSDPVYSVINYSNAYNGLDQTSILEGTPYASGNYGGQILLYFNTANVGTGNLSLCIASINCGTQGGGETGTVQAYVSSNNGGPFNITGGSLTTTATTAVTPEPSSLLLFGTGLLGAVGLFGRRRLLAKS
jgi:hypothetical protein